MISSRPARLLIIALTSAIVGYLVLLVAVPFLGFGWHMFHEPFLISNGYRIPVPKGFYVNGSALQPTMWKHSFGIPLLKRPFGMIGVRPFPPGTNVKLGDDFENSSASMIIAVAQ
jgi:hypothetical protein